MKAVWASVIGLALSIASPAVAWADGPAAPAPAPVEPATSAIPQSGAPPAVGGSTTLPTRPSKPLALAKPAESTPIGYKLVAGLGIAAAAALWLKNKRKANASTKDKPRSVIDVVGRTSVGVRSELLVVDVEGTRLLVGMTPSAISTLAVLETPEDDAPVAFAIPSSASSTAPGSGLDREPEALPAFDDRVRSLFEARAAAPVVAHKPEIVRAPKLGAKRAPRATTTPKTPRVAGQAKGLLLALEEPKPESKS